MTGTGDWRALARRLFGTDDISAIRAQLDDPALDLSADELRVRRGVVFLALAEDRDDEAEIERSTGP
jgi:hypothetical protein